MREVKTEQVFALHEEVEGELFDVALVDNEQENPTERVLADVLGDAVFEEGPEEKGEQQGRAGR